MIELSKHIECLLLKHNCVIVPGLGGFVTQYMPARRVADEQLFLPPYRSVGFNAQLNINDGLLVQSYMQAYDTTYPETLKLIDDAVRQIKDELQAKGAYTLHGIGTITLAHNGTYNFAPCEAGVPSPELYGFDSFTLKERTVGASAAEQAEAAMEAAMPKKRLKPMVKRTNKDITISINRELFNYVAAAVVAIVFYFIWATPIASTTGSEPMTASMLNEQLFNLPKKQTPAATPLAGSAADTMLALQQMQQAQNEEKAVTPDLFKATPAATSENATTPSAATALEKQAQEEAEAAKAAAKAKADAAKPYTIVLVSAVSRKGAEEFTAELKAKGMTEAEVVTRGRMTRVVYGRYASEGEASKALQTLRGKTGCPDAWVLEM